METMKRFDEQALAKRLQNLSKERQVLFCAFCSERLFPVYGYFHHQKQWGDCERMRNLLDGLWEIGEGRSISIERSRASLAQLDEITPLQDELYDTDLAARVIDLYYAVRSGYLCLSEDGGQVAAMAGRAVDETCHAYATVALEHANPFPLNGQRVPLADWQQYNDTIMSGAMSHPIVQHELSLQEEVLHLIEHPGEITPRALFNMSQSQPIPIPVEWLL